MKTDSKIVLSILNVINTVVHKIEEKYLRTLHGRSPEDLYLHIIVTCINKPELRIKRNDNTNRAVEPI